jgi:flavin reductase (DIM6/NTAB) family NADH-FMN oxidoreductase RutF
MASRQFVIRSGAMELDPNAIGAAAAYKLLIGCVVPRPIAWVSTVDAAGVRNLAPFSFFMGVCGEPPTIAFSSGPREGGRKDTVRNAERSGEFVVNVVDDAHAEAMNATSGEYAPDVDEFTVAGLAAAPSVRVKAPRVATAPISLECRVAKTVRIGRGPHSVVFGEIVHIHVRDDLYDAVTGRIDVAALHPVGRLAGHKYSRTHDVFEMKRPNPDYQG